MESCILQSSNADTTGWLAGQYYQQRNGMWSIIVSHVLVMVIQALLKCC